MYVVKTAPPHGDRTRIFATQDIKPGTLILSDKALLSFRVKSEGSKTYSDEDKAKLLKDASELDKPTFEKIKAHCENAFGRIKATYLNKKHVENKLPQTEKLLIDTILNQGIQICEVYDHGEVFSYQLFGDFHSLQHSCNPNAHVNDRTHDMEVRAMRTISKGEEISYSHWNPFQRKEKRQRSPRAQGCRCEICSGVEKQKGLNEQLYCDLEKKFEVVNKFRARFFGGLEVVDLSKAHQDLNLFEKASAISALSPPEIREVLEACQWIDEKKDEFGLMHMCFAELHEVIHLMNFAFVVGRADGPSWWSDRVADYELFVEETDKESSESHKSDSISAVDGRAAAEDTAQTSRELTERTTQPSENNVEQSSNGDDKEGVSAGHGISSPIDTEAHAHEARHNDTLWRSLSHAFTAKLQEMKISVLCNGVEHHRSQANVKHAVNITRRRPDYWWTILQQSALVLSFNVLLLEDGKHLVVNLEEHMGRVSTLPEALETLKAIGILKGDLSLEGTKDSKQADKRGDDQRDGQETDEVLATQLKGMKVKDGGGLQDSSESDQDAENEASKGFG